MPKPKASQYLDAKDLAAILGTSERFARYWIAKRPHRRLPRLMRYPGGLTYKTHLDAPVELLSPTANLSAIRDGLLREERERLRVRRAVAAYNARNGIRLAFAPPRLAEALGEP